MNPIENWLMAQVARYCARRGYSVLIGVDIHSPSSGYAVATSRREMTCFDVRVIAPSPATTPAKHHSDE